MELRGTLALVTGGNGGLGQRICHALAAEGANIAVVYARSHEQATGVAPELTSRYQIDAAAFGCDIVDGTAIERLIGDVTKRFGRIDILVNDAAYNKSIPFPDLDNLTEEVWDKIMAVNLTGPMRLTKAVAPIMKAQGQGRIVNIASLAPLRPTRASTAYAPPNVARLGCAAGGPLPPAALHGGGAATRTAGTLRRAGTAGRHARHRQSAARADRAVFVRLTPQEGRRQRRLRRHGGDDVPHRHDDR